MQKYSSQTIQYIYFINLFLQMTFGSQFTIYIICILMELTWNCLFISFRITNRWEKIQDAKVTSIEAAVLRCGKPEKYFISKTKLMTATPESHNECEHKRKINRPYRNTTI